MRFASFLSFLLTACAIVTAAAWIRAEVPRTEAVASKIPTSIDAGEVDADRLSRDAAGLFVLGGALFTGTLVEQEAGALVERSAYVDGRRHGLSERWHPDGTMGYRATYRDGRRHGTVETWWPGGARRSEAYYVRGVADGVQREWYRSGAPFKELHLVEGREEGLQRAWRENGALYANYEARDGRIYGLKRANLCYELDGEQIVVD